MRHVYNYTHTIMNTQRAQINMHCLDCTRWCVCVCVYVQSDTTEHISGEKHQTTHDLRWNPRTFEVLALWTSHTSILISLACTDFIEPRSSLWHTRVCRVCVFVYFSVCDWMCNLQRWISLPLMQCGLCTAIVTVTSLHLRRLHCFISSCNAGD